MYVASPRTEKWQDLPSLCVESILKFTPSSKLVHLKSNAVPLPGAYWSSELEAVLKKRRLCLVADPCYYLADRGPIVVVDAAGAIVASIKHPEAFRFSPILKLIESACLNVCAAVVRNNCGKVFVRVNRGDVLQFCVCDGEAVLSNLQNVKHLSLALCGDATRFFDENDLLVSNLKHLLPELESFVIKHLNPTSIHENQNVCNFLHALLLYEMTNLQLLHLPGDVFRCAIEQPIPGNSSVPVLSRLSSLGIWQGDHMTSAKRADVLRFVSTYGSALSVLFVFVSGEFNAYLDAFRSLSGLKTLGMDIDLADVRLSGLTFDLSEVIHSVSDLRIISDTSSDSGTRDRVIKITTFFPNVRAVSVKTAYRSSDPLELATSLFTEKQFIPGVAKLSCFLSDESFSLWSHHLIRFLANSHLPEAVDLSPCIFDNLSSNAGYVRAIFISMQSNSIKSLLLRGPMHREALSRLQSHLTLNGEDANVSAWKNRDLGAQPGIFRLTEISEQTDIKIVGTKTSGSLKGKEFTIRVFHQLAKRVDIFD